MAGRSEETCADTPRPEERRDEASAAASPSPSMGPWERIKRHKIAQWTLAYAAGAYTLLHTTNMVSDALDWPHLVVRIVTLLLLLGLPLAVTLAWFHGYRAQQRISGSELAILTVFLVLAAGVLWVLGRPTPTPATDSVPVAATPMPPDTSIAVLPFVNMSSDPEQEYFSDGMAEQVLDLLSRIPELRVIARTSSFSFKGKDVDVAVIAQRLNVAHVLEGSVRKSGNRVRITAQLTKAADSSHLWSETYDRELSDIFAIQDEIAAAVVTRLRITLLGAIPTAERTDPQAYALLLQARQFGRLGTDVSLGKSLALYQQALAIDPNYAAAWVDLARIYIVEHEVSRRPHAEAYRLSRQATSKALAINPDNALAIARLAWFAKVIDQDLAAAARHLEHALALEPANPLIIKSAASLALDLGRLDQGCALLEYVLRLDPLDPETHALLGKAYRAAARFDEALTSHRTSLNLSPGRAGAHGGVGNTLLAKGDPEAALAEWLQEPADYIRLIGLADVYHSLGQRAKSDAALGEFIAKYEKENEYLIAGALAWRGEVGRSFEWLEKVAHDDHALPAIALLDQWQFANLQDDPRWLPFLRKIGKAPEQLAAIEFDVRLPGQ